MRRASLLVCGAVFTATSTTVLAFPPAYNIFSLGPLPGNTSSSGLGISPNGTYASGFSDSHGVRWTQGGGTVGLPDLPGRAFNTATAVNNNGVAVGTGATTFFGSSPLPIIWANPGTVAQLPLPAGQTIGRTYGVNINELAVGSVNGGSLEVAATFSTGGSSVITQTLPNGGLLRTAYAINDAGRIVGQGLDPNNAAVTTGWYLDPGDATATSIGALTSMGHNSAIPFGVSSNGLITGSSSLNSGANALPFIWSQANGMEAVPLPVGTTTGQGRGVNSSGWVVGNSSSVTSIPFLYDGNTSQSLQSLIANLGGWDLVSGTSNAAYGISDNGIITGRGLLNGAVTGFVMIPVPEPMTVALLGLGALLVRRRFH